MPKDQKLIPTLPAPSGEKSLPSFEETEEDTSPHNQIFALSQQFFLTFDILSMEEKQMLIELTSAFARITLEEKKLLVAAAEKFAGL